MNEVIVDRDDVNEHLFYTHYEELIRCKNCVHFGTITNKEKPYCYWHFDSVLEKDYCSYAERKEE